MSQQEKTRHFANSQITTEGAVITTDGNTPNVPGQKRKEDAKQILYLDRV
jgi:hypothetical protein